MSLGFMKTTGSADLMLLFSNLLTIIVPSGFSSTLDEEIGFFSKKTDKSFFWPLLGLGVICSKTLSIEF